MDPGVYIVRCAWGACRRRCGGGGVAGEAFGVGGPLLCSGCSGGGSWQIRRPRRVRRFLELRRASPRAGVRDGGAGSCSWGSSAFTSVLGGAFAQDLWELQAGSSSSTAGSGGFVEEGWCWWRLGADGRSTPRCRCLRRLDHAAFQHVWPGRRLRCEVSSPSSSPAACCCSSRRCAAWWLRSRRVVCVSSLCSSGCVRVVVDLCTRTLFKKKKPIVILNVSIQ